MTDKSLRVVARVKAKADKAEEVRSLLTGLIEPTRSESGCVSYELLQNHDDPTDFTFVEEWTGRSAFDAHLETEHFQNVKSKVIDLLDEAPDIRTYKVVG